MSDRPEREWAAAKAMYEANYYPRKKWEDLPPGAPQQRRWLSLARRALKAAEEYSRSVSHVR